MIIKIIPSFILCIAVSVGAMAQYSKTIDSLREVKQTCFDKGWRMPACAYQYYFQIDSLMNIVYKRLLSILTVEKRTSLAKKQRLWLKERDRYFKLQDKGFRDSLKTGDYGPEMRVIKIDAKSAFVESRLWQLIQQMPASSVVKKPASK